MSEDTPRAPGPAPATGPGETKREGELPPSREGRDSAETAAPAADPPAAGKPTMAPEPANPASRPLPPVPASARQLGPYEILGELGRGGMGVVYKAFHPGLKRTVALKVLIAGEDASEEAITRFHREAESVAKLGHHPNIVPVYDIGHVPGHGAGGTGHIHYIAMHFVEGKPLDKMIDEGTIPPRRAAEIARKVADALAHAHAHGILHRDIKPANILMARARADAMRNLKSQIPNPNEISNLKTQRPQREGEAPAEPNPPGQGAGGTGHTEGEAGTGEGAQRASCAPRPMPHAPCEEWEPMITDFGLAKDVESQSTMTRSGAALGTPNYMPPEQAEGRPGDIDARSDVWSLGATLYEMLAGRPPFEGDTVAQVIRKVLLEDPRSPRRANPAVDRDLETICLKCLEKDRDRRYAGAAALARDLGNFLEGSPIAARPASLGYRAMRAARRHGAAVVTGLVAALVLLSGGILAAVWVAEARREKARETEKAREQEGRAASEGDRAAREATERAEAQRLLDQERRVSRVVLDANLRLGGVHAELQRCYFDATTSNEAKTDLFERHGKEIEAFFAAYLDPGSRNGDSASGARPPASAPDPAQAATALALKGWLTWLGGHGDEALALFQRSRKLNDEIAWGALLEGVVWLENYLENVEFPSVAFSGFGGIEFGAVPAENREMRISRERLAALVRGRGKPRPGCDTALRALGEVAEGFRAMEKMSLKGADPQTGAGTGRDPAEEALVEAEGNLDAALGTPELGWMRGTLLFARAQVKYLRRRFDAGVADLQEAMSVQPGRVALHEANGLYRLAGAHEVDLRGGDPGDLLRDSIRAYGEVLRRKPKLVSTLQHRGMARVSLANAELERGQDSRESFAGAIRDVDEALRLDAGYVEAYNCRGSARLGLGDAMRARGDDPREPYRRALDDFEEVLRRDPANRSLHANLGSAYRSLAEADGERGQDSREGYRKAIAEFSEAMARDPEDSSVYTSRGTAYFGLGNDQVARGEDAADSFDRAIEDFGQSQRRTPEQAKAYGNRGNAYARRGEVERLRGRDPLPLYRMAIDEYGQALSRNPEFTDAYCNRGATLVSRAEIEAERGLDPTDSLRQAASDFDRALARNRESTLAYANRASLWRFWGSEEERRGRDPGEFFRKALEDCEEALRRNPGYGLAILNRGHVCVQIGRHESRRGGDAREWFGRAIREYGEALRRNPCLAPACFGRGRAYGELGDGERKQGRDPRDTYRKAIEEYGLALRWNPNDASALCNRGGMYGSIGRAEAERGADPRDSFRQAMRDLEGAIERRPGEAGAYHDMGLTCVGLGDAAAARGEDPRAWFLRAIDEFGRMLARQPRSADAYACRAKAHSRLAGAEAARGGAAEDVYRKALDDCAQAARLGPSDADNHFTEAFCRVRMAMAEAARGSDATESFRQAIEACGRVLALAPGHAEAHNIEGFSRYSLGKAAESRGEDPRDFYRKAIESFAKAIAGGPGNAEVPKNRAVAHSSLGDAEAARGGDPREHYAREIEDWGRALAAHEDPWFHFYRGYAWGKRARAEAARGADPRGSIEEAIASYGRAVEKNPLLWQAWTNRGDMCERSGRFEEAARCYGRAREAADSPPPQLEAVEARARAAAAGPPCAQALAQAALLMEMGSLGIPCELFEKALAEADAAGRSAPEAQPASRVPLGDRYNLVCCLSMLSAGRKGRLAERVPVPAEEAASLRARAVSRLRECLEMGWSDLDHLRKDSDLDPIRELPEFRALMREREQKPGK